METVFRLVLQRPAVSQADETPSIALAQKSAMQTELVQAAASDETRTKMKAVAKKFTATVSFVGDPKPLPEFSKFKELAERLDKLELKDHVSHSDVVKAVEDAFGDKPADIVQTKLLEPLAADLRDSIIAIKQLPEEHWRPIEDLANILRDIELIQKTANDVQFPGSGPALRRYRRRCFALPIEINLGSILSGRARETERQKSLRISRGRRQEAANAAFTVYKRLVSGIDELTKLGPQFFNVSVQTASGEVLPDPSLRPLSIFAEEVAKQKKLLALAVKRAETLIDKVTTTENPIDAAEATPVVRGAVATRVPLLRRFAPGTAAFQPVPPTGIGFRLNSGALAALSKSTRDLLAERNLSITDSPLDGIVTEFKSELARVAHEIDDLIGPVEQFSFKRLGATLVKIRTARPTDWNELIYGTLGPTFPTSQPDVRVPISHGSITPVGIADLLVIKQQLKAYEAMDVAHIENVLLNESKVRDHRRLDQTEETTFEESETTKTDEHDLESTDRFEMKRESEQTIKEDASLKAGVTVSGSYGPSIQFSASAEGSLSRSKEEATKAATTFSKDVTDRTSTKLTERILQRITRRVLNEIEEKNNHTLNNVGGHGNIAGVYQWVQKVYEAQMWNYGLREMYDFMVPEPAAYLITAMSTSHASMLEIEKPVEFTLRPDQISESNYSAWVHRYGATDVTPPPEPYITKTADYSAGGGDDKTNYTHSGQITIEDGYEAIHATASSTMNIWEANAVVDVLIGSRSHRFANNQSWVWSTALDNETVSIAWGMKTWGAAEFTLTIEVKCHSTIRALNKWRLETHAKLVNAYNAKLADYEERLNAIALQAGVTIKGKNPGLNLELMKDELKKHCITILTDQHYDLFDAIDSGPYDTEQINLFENEAEGPYVRFFEQGFEWEQMTWLTYPYFWGRKSMWSERVAYEDVDPLFNQFLKAGYCRVSVPVRPGFEGALDHFRTHGEIWAGGPLPAISDPLFLPIADEIAERLDRPGSEYPQGDPWDVHVPTTLVHLRGDDKLPAWKKNAQGEWVPV